MPSPSETELAAALSSETEYDRRSFIPKRFLLFFQVEASAETLNTTG